MLPQPALSARLHRNTPQDFLNAIIDIIATGVGMPALFNDDIIVPSLQRRDIPIDDARDYAIIGCVEPGWQGRGCCVSNAAYFNLLKCLELTLGNGTCLLTGRKVSIESGEAESLASMDDLLAAYGKQIAFWVKRMVDIFNVIEKIHAENIPFPFNSMLVSDCLDRATDYLSGGARYNLNGTQGVGIANMADALSAIDHVVYREGKLSLTELIDTLKNNFEGSEYIHQYILNRIPRYGNDDDRADALAREVGQIYCMEVEKHRSPRGARYHPGLYPVSANVPLGRDVAASPDGRKAREPLADGIAPCHDADMKGPTAVLCSVAKINQVLSSNGTQLNQKFLPSMLTGENMREKFAHYLRTFIDLPIQELQFNVVKRKTLVEAQRKPERHRNLVVRVAGYSAFFNDLDRSTQDDIIGRTEQTFS
jgi:formate C-acetyltransferase